MKHNKKITRFTFTFKTSMLLLVCFLFANTLNAQVERTSDLFKTLQEKDRLLFEEGFNKCDTSQFENLISEDVEFYHDQSGIINSKEQFMENTKNVLCKEGFKKNNRVLVKDSLQVFALYDQGKLYGAIQTGVHQFGNSDAKFTHLWLLENGVWKLSRVLSFEHKELPKPKKKN